MCMVLQERGPVKLMIRNGLGYCWDGLGIAARSFPPFLLSLPPLKILQLNTEAENATTTERLRLRPTACGEKDINIYVGLSDMPHKRYRPVLEKDIDTVNGAFTLIVLEFSYSLDLRSKLKERRQEATYESGHTGTSLPHFRFFLCLNYPTHNSTSLLATPTYRRGRAWSALHHQRAPHPKNDQSQQVVGEHAGKATACLGC